MARSERERGWAQRLLECPFTLLRWKPKNNKGPSQRMGGISSWGLIGLQNSAVVGECACTFLHPTSPRAERPLGRFDPVWSLVRSRQRFVHRSHRIAHRGPPGMVAW
jgi:hypothetical protein